MNTPQKEHSISKREILFPTGNRAQLVAPPPGISVAFILKALDIEQPKALILIIGGAASLDKAMQPRLTQLFSRGIARAAADPGALIMDGGTQAGVMVMMGQGVADRGRKSVLLGVAPCGKVTFPGGPAEGSIEDGAPLDPDHSHFVLVESSEWGGETETMFELAKALAKGKPVVTVLVNGGDIARKEVLLSVRQGWPIIVIEGSGRLADEIARLWKEKPPFVEDSVVNEIIADGNILLFPLDDLTDNLERLVRQHISMDSTLKLAWERFAFYDNNAKRQQTGFDRLQRWIPALGVFATMLALSQKELSLKEWFDVNAWNNKGLHYLIVIIPITVSILIAAANRFKAGNKWVLLRAGAEAIKREIYRYRTQAEIYSDQHTAQRSREEKLVHKVEAISRKLLRTEVNLSALLPYEGPIPPNMYGAAETDDGYSCLSPKQYLTIRLGDQLNYYQLKTTKLESQLKRLQWLIYIFGGVGTFLAAVGLELWIALTTAFVGAFTTYLEYQQVENTLMKYNQAATDLENVKAWWAALPVREKTKQENIDKLIAHTERVLQSELTGWVQQMEDSLAELRPQQAGERSGTQSS